MPELNFNLLAPTAELYSGPQVQMDPVAAYEKAKATRQSNMLAQLYAKHYDPQTGGVNYNALIPEAAQSGLDVSQLMPGVREQQESMASIAQKRALQQQEEATAAAKQQEMDQAKMKQLATESYGRFRSVKNADDLLAWHLANPELPGTNKAERTARLQAQLAQPGGYEAARSEIEAALQDITGIKPEKVAETELAKNIREQKNYAKGSPEWNAYQGKINDLSGGMSEYQRQELGLAKQRLNLDQTKAAANLTDLPIKEIQKREAALPKAKVAFDASSTDIDSLITDLTNLANHPGLNTITGARAGTGIVKGITTVASQDAANAQTLLNKIKAKGTLRSLVDLRNSSPTGGALGNVSDADVRLLTNSFANIDTTQGTSEFKQSINDIIGQLSATKTRLKDAFDDTYSYRSGGTPSAPAASTTQKPAARTVVRTGTANGKKVVQYSDGSVEYAP